MRPDSRFARGLVACSVVGLLCLAAVHGAAQEGAYPAVDPLPSYAEPGISPDGAEIAFVTGGDIWTVPTGGGIARLLVTHPANESRPLYSPDGARLAFVSNRTGSGDIYVLTLASGDLQRITYSDGSDLLDGWSPDGRWLYYSTTSFDMGGSADVYRVNAQGGTPMPVLEDPYGAEYHAAASPGGETLAVAARGRMALSQWWRNGHSHIDEAEIWLARIGGDTPEYGPLVNAGDEKAIWPMWAPDGDEVFYVSDRSGAENLWVVDVASGEGRQVTRFSNGRVLWPSISRGGAIAFERDFGIWVLESPDASPREVAVELRGVTVTPAVTHRTFSSGLSGLTLSPDGKKLAFIVHGEIFAASAEDGGHAARVTRTHQAESEVAWAADSRRLAYVSRRGGTSQIYLYDFADDSEEQLTRGDRSNTSPLFSPDGSSLAYVRNGRELRVMDVESGESRTLATGTFSAPPYTNTRAIHWSPDGEWIAYLHTSPQPFTNVWVVPAEGGESRPVSGLANSFAGSVSWSSDGSFILFATGQRTEDWNIARIDLVPRTPRFREDRFAELFEEEEEEEEETEVDVEEETRIVFDDIRRRASFLSLGLNANSQVLAPDGKSVVVTASAEGRTNLYVYSLDELSDDPAVPRQLTSTAGGKSWVQFTPDGEDILYLERGRIQKVSVEGGSPRSISVTAEMEVDFEEEKREVFDQAWSYMRDFFYDEDYHGADWDDIRRTFEPHVAGARTTLEMRRLLNLMLGELNGSHLGASGSSGFTATGVGRLGLDFDRGEYEREGRLRVTGVAHLGPAHVSGEIAVGDYLTAVNGTPITANTSLDDLLENTVGRQVTLTLSSDGSGSGSREVVVKPISRGAEGQLTYREWVEGRRAYVDRVSDGRLGYVHMSSMGWGALLQLFVDLDAENHGKEGVVIDIRGNNGGFVNVYAMDVFSRRGYLTMTRRGGSPGPGRSWLGQRSLESPTILVIDQNTLSDGEDFTEGYRELGLGQVVGSPTAGWIIYTGGQSLIDGTSLRMPQWRVTDNRGQTMELNPRPVDIPVERPAGESYTGVDSQLDAAVRALLRAIDQGR